MAARVLRLTSGLRCLAANASTRSPAIKAALLARPLSLSASRSLFHSSAWSSDKGTGAETVKTTRKLGGGGKKAAAGTAASAPKKPATKKQAAPKKTATKVKKAATKKAAPKKIVRKKAAAPSEWGLVYSFLPKENLLKNALHQKLPRSLSAFSIPPSE